jgi:hypothetical protein
MLLKSWLLVLKAGWNRSTGDRRAVRHSRLRRREVVSSSQLIERFEDRTLLSTIYVDETFAGVSTGSQTNPFTTIQAGVNAAAPGGGDTVQVAPGTYAENVTIDRPLTLDGAKAGADANTRFAAFTTGVNGPKADPTVETVLTAPVVNPTAPNPNANDLIRVLASGVTIDGLVVDGNNPTLGASPVQVGTVNIDARRGIDNIDANDNPVPENNLVVQNDIIQNVAQRGISLFNGVSASTGNLITGNVIRNFGSDPVNGGEAVLLLDDAYADITNNTIVDNLGQISLQLGNFSRNGSMTWSGNDITVGQDGIGIHANLFYAPTGVLNISNNNVHAAAGVTSTSGLTWGINVWSVQVGATVNVTNNTVGASGGQFARGVNFWNVPTGNTVTLSGGSISNSDVGVDVTSIDPYFGQADDSTVNIQGVTINGGTTGVNVQAQPLATPPQFGSNTPTGSVTANLTGNIITGSTTGVEVQGYSAGVTATATLSMNTITGSATGVKVDDFGNLGSGSGPVLTTGNVITGNTTGIAISAGAGTIQPINQNDLSGNTQAMANSSSTVVDATNNWWGTTNSAAVGVAAGPNVTYIPFLGAPPSQPFTINGTAGSDTLKLVQSGTNLDIYVGGVLTYTFPLLSTPHLIFNGNGGGDSLTIDYSGGQFYTPITWNAGADNTGSLSIVGGTFKTDTYNETDAHSGNVQLFSQTDHSTAAITYTGLAPLANTGTAADIIFNLPAGVSNQASLEDDGTLNNGISQLRSVNSTFELTTFANPTGSLTINDGSMGDLNTISQLDDGFAAPITINGGAGNDRMYVNFASGVNVIPIGGITFTGGGGADGFALQPGYSATEIAHAFAGAGSGSVTVDGNAINYSGMNTAVGIYDQLAATIRTFTFSGTGNDVTLHDDPTPNDNFDRIQSTASSVTVDFKNPSGLLSVTPGTGGDTLTVGAMDAQYKAALTVNGATGSSGDTVNLNGALTLGSATSTGLVAVKAETINVNAGISTNGSGTAGGSVTLTGATSLGAVTINTSGTANSGDISLNGPVSFSGTGQTASLIAAGNGSTGTIAFQTDVNIGANTLNVWSDNAVTFPGITTVGSVSADGSLVQQGLGNLAIQPGATLTGRGTVSGPLVILDAVLDPGAGVGKLTLSGYSGTATAQLTGTPTFLIHMNGTTPGGGATGYDQLVTTAQTPVTISPTTQLAITLGAGFSAGVGSSYDIITGTGTINGTFANLPNNQLLSVNGQVFRIVYTTTKVTLTRVVDATIVDDLAGSQPPNTSFVATGPTWNPNTVHDGRGFNQELLFSSAGNGTTFATWTFNNLTPGAYEVSATWKENPNRATNAPYTVSSSGAGASPTLNVAVDQQLAPSTFTEDDGGTNTSVHWQDLSSSFTVGASGTLTVQLNNLANGFVIADAIRVQSLTPPVTVLQPALGVQIDGTSITSGGAAFDLGTEPHGTVTPNTATLQITNTGFANLDLSPLGALPAGFLATGTYPTTLAPNQSASVTITLDPSVTGGTYNGTLSLASNDPSSPFLVNLTGIVTGPGTGLKVDGSTTPNDSTLDFGTELTGTNAPVIKTVMITNTGNADLVLGAMSAVPTGYIVAGYSAQTLTPGNSVSFTIKLDETAPPATYTGTITIPSNDPSTNPISFSLTGIVASRIIDNSSPATVNGSYAEAAGSAWQNNTVAGAGYLGNLRFAAAGTTSSATWTFNGLNPADTFTIDATWRPYSNRATNAPYTIVGAASQTVFVDQTATPNDVTDAGGNFKQLAINVLPDATGHITVTISTTGIAAGTYVIADAVRIVDPPSTLNSATPNPADYGPTETVDLSRVYRVYNPNASLHTFTTNGSEASILVDQFHYSDESQDPGFAILPTHVDGSTPLYRMYDQNNGQHYLTPSAAERDALLSIDPSGHGWTYEGVEGEVYTAPHAGATELFMLYNDLNGEHLYTPYASEVTGVLAIPGGHWHQQASLGFAYTIDGLTDSATASTQTAQETEAPSAGAMALSDTSGASAAPASPATAIAVAQNTLSTPSLPGGENQVSPAPGKAASTPADSTDQASQDQVFASDLGSLLDLL